MFVHIFSLLQTAAAAGQSAVAWHSLGVVVYLFRRLQTIHYTHNTKITITKAGNQKGNAHHAGHFWHKRKNNYLTICQD